MYRKDTVAPDYPLFLYEYDADGKYGRPLDLANQPALILAMKTIIRPAIAEKREVLITDGDDCCVFHTKEGIVVFPEELKSLEVLAKWRPE